jgi:hypothetical protein
MSEKTKFIMMDDSENYAYEIAVYGKDFHNAKIFEGNPEDYKKFGNEIIPLKSKKGLEIMAKEIENLDPEIDLMFNRVNQMLEGRNKFYKNSPELREYIKERNEKIHPLLGIDGDTKQNIIEGIYKKSVEVKN